MTNPSASATGSASAQDGRFQGVEARARIAAVIAILRERYGARLSTGTAVREQHGHGEAFAKMLPPDAVVWPQSTEEVSAIVALCH